MSFIRQRLSNAGRARTVGVLVSVVAVMMLVVVPALASQAGPESDLGVVPTVVTHTGGDWVADCSAEDVNSAADSGIWINNPRTGTYTSEAGIVVELVVNGDSQQFDFDLTGARALDVIVKGGVDSNWYSYDPFEINGEEAVGTKSDGMLGAPGGHKNRPANLSHVSICLDTSGSISGSKWRDHDNDGQVDGFERGLAGWTIKAFDTEGAEAGSAITEPDGTYTISGLMLDQTYTVCEFAPTEETGFEYRGWIQSIPADEADVCGDYSGAEPNGYPVVLAGDVLEKDFFNVRTITIPVELDKNGEPVLDSDGNPVCGMLPEGGIFTVGDGLVDPIGTITVDPGNCKPGEYVFETYVDGDNQIADFYPTFDPGGQTMPLVEDYEWVITGTNTQQTLFYNDVPPFDGEREMLFCSKPWSLGQSTDGVLPSGETSCLLETHEVTMSDGIHRTDTVFTLADGRRTLR